VPLRLATREDHHRRIEARRSPGKVWRPLRILVRAPHGSLLQHAEDTAAIFADALRNTEPARFARAARALPAQLRPPNVGFPPPLVGKPSAQVHEVRLAVCSDRGRLVLLPGLKYLRARVFVQ